MNTIHLKEEGYVLPSKLTPQSNANIQPSKTTQETREEANGKNFGPSVWKTPE